MLFKEGTAILLFEILLKKVAELAIVLYSVPYIVPYMVLLRVCGSLIF